VSFSLERSAATPPGLQDCHAVITGGGSGIGAAIADALAALGCRLTLLGRSQPKLTAKAASLPLARGRSADVTNQADIAAAFAAATSEFGPVSILVNNAGLAPAGPFLQIDPESWQTALDVNLTGAFFCAQAALPGMVEAGWGRIVMIASTAGLMGYKGVAAYVAAKHGMIGLTRALALEFAQTGVTINAVCPGFTETDIALAAIDNIRARSGRSETEARAVLSAKNPQGRLVRPQEVANSVAWLCGEGSSAITGQSIAVCGGEVMT
jgi:NAD(P)-dependent dehydrogenase (short-subunit alcohol dehydrogenase family)